MTKAIRIYETGGPEVLKWEDIQLEDPESGQVRLKHTAIGLNFIDCYHRSGLYPAELPLTLGSEAVGIIEAIGPNVTGFEIGQRVTYCGGQTGSYSMERNIDANVLIPLPNNINDKDAAAMMLKGLTAHMLMFKCYQVKKGDTILIHAAAGGVGSVAIAILAKLGYTVIAGTGRQEAHDYLSSLGATSFVEREELEGEGRPLDRALWAGAIDNVGSTILANVASKIKQDGAISVCGNAAGVDLPTTVLPLILRGISLNGINSVEVPTVKRVEIWQRLVADLDKEKLDSMTNVVSFNDLLPLSKEILEGKVRGRTVVDVNA